MPPPLRLRLPLSLFTPKLLLPPATLPKATFRSFSNQPPSSPSPSSFQTHPKVLARLNRSLPPPPRVIAHAGEVEGPVNWGRVMGVSVGAVGLMAVWKAVGGGGRKSGVWCEAQIPSPPSEAPIPPPAQSMVNPYELTFGAVCGICAGIFIKKGAKALAFLLGGVFVLLQYLSSVNILQVNWSRASSAYETLTSSPSTVPGGKPVGLTVGRVWAWGVDFLTRDFQQRATFLGGLALGLRVG